MNINIKSQVCSLMILICFSSFVLLGCSLDKGEKSADRKVVAQINNFKMTVEDLGYELNNVPYDEKALLNTPEGRKEFLERIIEKEILLQEAQRMGMDKDRDFMKAIERYWEQTLIKLLLEKKSKEISGVVHVYDNEIENYYKTSGAKEPLSKVRNDIQRAIRQEKETALMEEWIKTLKQNSRVKINEEAIDKVFNRNR